MSHTLTNQEPFINFINYIQITSNEFKLILTFINILILINHMTKEKFLLVSLSESKTKQLAQAVSNETCRKILDFLAEKESTESELAEKLNVPISTVHYNLQQLQKAKLVDVEEFHYSKKGREVMHYKLANKYIIIAPKSTYGIKEKLKSIIPVVGIIGVGAAFMTFFNRSFMKATEYSSRGIVSEDMAMEAAPKTAEVVEAEIVPLTATQPNLILYFLLGAGIALGLYLSIDWIRNR